MYRKRQEELLGYTSINKSLRQAKWIYPSQSIRIKFTKAYHNYYDLKESKRKASELLRYITKTRKDFRESMDFVRGIRQKLHIFHGDNLQLAESTLSYPFSNELKHLLIKYVEIESDALYASGLDPTNEIMIALEIKVKNQVLNFLRILIGDAVLYRKTFLQETNLRVRDKALFNIFVNAKTENKALVKSLITQVLQDLNQIDNMNQLRNTKIPYKTDPKFENSLAAKMRDELTSNIFDENIEEDMKPVILNLPTINESNEGPSPAQNYTGISAGLKPRLSKKESARVGLKQPFNFIQYLKDCEKSLLIETNIPKTLERNIYSLQTSKRLLFKEEISSATPVNVSSSQTKVVNDKQKCGEIIQAIPEKETTTEIKKTDDDPFSKHDELKSEDNNKNAEIVEFKSIHDNITDKDMEGVTCNKEVSLSEVDLIQEENNEEIPSKNDTETESLAEGSNLETCDLEDSLSKVDLNKAEKDADIPSETGSLAEGLNKSETITISLNKDTEFLKDDANETDQKESELNGKQSGDFNLITNEVENQVIEEETVIASTDVDGEASSKETEDIPSEEHDEDKMDLEQNFNKQVLVQPDEKIESASHIDVSPDSIKPGFDEEASNVTNLCDIDAVEYGSNDTATKSPKKSSGEDLDILFDCFNISFSDLLLNQTIEFEENVMNLSVTFSTHIRDDIQNYSETSMEGTENEPKVTVEKTRTIDDEIKNQKLTNSEEELISAFIQKCRIDPLQIVHQNNQESGKKSEEDLALLADVAITRETLVIPNEKHSTQDFKTESPTKAAIVNNVYSQVEGNVSNDESTDGSEKNLKINEEDDQTSGGFTNLDEKIVKSDDCIKISKPESVVPEVKAAITDHSIEKVLDMKEPSHMNENPQSEAFDYSITKTDELVTKTKAQKKMFDTNHIGMSTRSKSCEQKSQTETLTKRTMSLDSKNEVDEMKNESEEIIVKREAKTKRNKKTEKTDDVKLKVEPTEKSRTLESTIQKIRENLVVDGQTKSKPSLEQSVLSSERSKSHKKKSRSKDEDRRSRSSSKSSTDGRKSRHNKIRTSRDKNEGKRTKSRKPTTAFDVPSNKETSNIKTEKDEISSTNAKKDDKKSNESTSLLSKKTKSSRLIDDIKHDEIEEKTVETVEKSKVGKEKKTPLDNANKSKEINLPTKLNNDFEDDLEQLKNSLHNAKKIHKERRVRKHPKDDSVKTTLLVEQGKSKESNSDKKLTTRLDSHVKQQKQAVIVDKIDEPLLDTESKPLKKRKHNSDNDPEQRKKVETYGNVHDTSLVKKVGQLKTSVEKVKSKSKELSNASKDNASPQRKKPKVEIKSEPLKDTKREVQTDTVSISGKASDIKSKEVNGRKHHSEQRSSSSSPRKKSKLAKVTSESLSKTVKDEMKEPVKKDEAVPTETPIVNKTLIGNLFEKPIKNVVADAPDDETDENINFAINLLDEYNSPSCETGNFTPPSQISTIVGFDTPMTTERDFSLQITTCFIPVERVIDNKVSGGDPLVSANPLSKDEILKDFGLEEKESNTDEVTNLLKNLNDMVTVPSLSENTPSSKNSCKSNHNSSYLASKIDKFGNSYGLDKLTMLSSAINSDTKPFNINDFKNIIDNNVSKKTVEPNAILSHVKQDSLPKVIVETNETLPEKKELICSPKVIVERNEQYENVVESPKKGETQKLMNQESNTKAPTKPKVADISNFTSRSRTRPKPTSNKPRQPTKGLPSRSNQANNDDETNIFVEQLNGSAKKSVAKSQTSFVAKSLEVPKQGTETKRSNSGSTPQRPLNDKIVKDEATDLFDKVKNDVNFKPKIPTPLNYADQVEAEKRKKEEQRAAKARLQSHEMHSSKNQAPLTPMGKKEKLKAGHGSTLKSTSQRTPKNRNNPPSSSPQADSTTYTNFLDNIFPTYSKPLFPPLKKVP